jgi:eukaryotic-like serine/threonine-protein kinase
VGWVLVREQQTPTHGLSTGGPVSLSIGQLIADRYRLVRRIAVGGMGEVWEAADARLGRHVAIKVLKAELSGDGEFLHRFRFEARTTASLNHPGIAAVHDYGETAAMSDGPADTAYLVMELVEGEPLAAMLARRRRLSPERTLDVLEQAGHALQAAHERGLVHRDVKPGNILFTAAGTVKLTDFGIAKAVDAAPVTRSGMVMGTAHYIAPEQAMGQEAGPASDVYSLGVVGYECLAGHRPFLSDSAVTVAMMHIRDSPPPLPPDTPPGVRALIESTLVKDPRSRYGTGGEFAGAVAAVRAGLPLPRPKGGFYAASTAAPVGPLNPMAPAAHGAADQPTGPQQRIVAPRHASGGPPTPIPPGSGPFVPPQQAQPSGQQPAPPTRPPTLPPHRRQPMRPPDRPDAGIRLGPWIVVGVLLLVALAVGGLVVVNSLGENRGSGPPDRPRSVTAHADHYRGQPTSDGYRDMSTGGRRLNLEGTFG